MIKAVIFDCFGVLTKDTWRAFLDSLPDDVDRQDASDINRAYDAGILDKQDFLDQIQLVTGTEPRQIESLRSNEISKNTELLSYIKELKQNYKIGLLSNIASDWITKTFLDKTEQALFDEMVFSFKEGMTKPNPQIFELICDKLDVNPSEAVMIDDIEGYCEAAERTGMKAVCYKNFAQLKAELSGILNQE